jgi:hypothetical protein
MPIGYKFNANAMMKLAIAGQKNISMLIPNKFFQKNWTGVKNRWNPML